MAALVLIGLLWGIPMYLVDKRARENRRPARARLIIALLMIWWDMIIPAVIALKLAGPKHRGPSRRRPAGYAPHGPWAYPEDEDDSAAQDHQRREREQEERDLQEA